MPHVFSVRDANGPLTSVERQVSGHARVLARDKAQQPSYAFSRVVRPGSSPTSTCPAAGCWCQCWCLLRLQSEAELMDVPAAVVLVDGEGLYAGWERHGGGHCGPVLPPAGVW